MPAPLGHTAYNVNDEGGRPKIFTKEVLDNFADLLEKWTEKKDNIFVEQFCYEHKIRKAKIAIWAKENERFSLALDSLKTKQLRFNDWWIKEKICSSYVRSYFKP